MPASYKAEQQSDGKWTIFGVPVFGELPENSEKGNTEAINRKWMRKAIAECTRRRDEDGYRPPLHAHHHGWDQTRPAGHFELTTTRNVLYDGETMVALFANFTDVPDEMFQRIRGGEFPYRSVEIFSFEKPVINSIALLDDEEPFFRFPNLDGNSIKVKEQAAKAGLRPAIMFSAAKCQEIAMQFTLEEVDGKIRLAENESGEVYEYKLGEGVRFMDDDKDEEIKKLRAELKAMKDKYAKAMKDKNHAKSDPVSPDPTPVNAGADNPEMAARLAATEDKVDNLLAEKAEDKLVAKAMADLKGYHLSDERKEQIRYFAAKGEEDVNKFVEAYKSVATPEPVKFDGTDIPVEDIPDELEEFKKDGPEVLTFAKKHYAEAKQLVEAGIVSDVASHIRGLALAATG